MEETRFTAGNINSIEEYANDLHADCARARAFFEDGDRDEMIKAFEWAGSHVVALQLKLNEIFAELNTD